jgi:phosphatidylglycerol:prolipoprotein diacylglycerol transferase
MKPWFVWDNPAILYILIIFFILMYLKNHRKFAGQLTIVYLLLYSVIRIIIEGLRTDSLMMGDIKISQLISIIIFLVVIFILIYNYKIKKKIKLLEEKNN